MKDHSIFFPTKSLRIPLSLHNIFSYFPSRTSNKNDFDDDIAKIIMKPDNDE